MHAVQPKEDCPHLSEHYNSSNLPTKKDIKIPGSCHECGSTQENWVCLSCWTIGCSRYVKEHQEAHYNSTKHCIAASFSDFSVWCYDCESYIKHSSLIPFLKMLHEEKFKPVDSSNEDDSDYKEESEESDQEISLDLLKQLMGVSVSKEQDVYETYLKDLSLEGIANAIKEGQCKNVIVLTGAGISVAAGIPDFRTPGTGLYDNLQKYGLPHPTAVFELDYFRNRPQPFFTLAKELFPGTYKPTAAHYFIKLLHDKGILLRNFTQNIDTLERVANVPGDAMVEAHGSFAEAHCITCRAPEKMEAVKSAIFSDTIPKCKICDGLVKPDIVFFGESLPERFFKKLEEDFPKCDLLIVIGTSLQVQPFASLIGRVKPTTPRILINREEVGALDPKLAALGLGGSNFFRFGLKNNYRDVALLGDCQEGVKKLAELCGWKNDLEDLIQEKKK